jgi:hypothetical protein
MSSESHNDVRRPTDVRRATASRRSMLAGTATGLLTGAGVMAATGILARPQTAEAATLGTTPDWLNITASPYNADPTGTSDSTSGIQAALNQVAANGGGAIYVPAGNYKITSGMNYNSSTGLLITGDGPQASNFRLASTSTSTTYLTITQTGEFVGGNLGKQGTVVIENVAFYNDQPTAGAFSDQNAVLKLDHVNFGQIRNVCIYQGTAPQWINQGMILNACNQVDIDNANLFTAVNGFVFTGYGQVNNISNTSIWGRYTGVSTAAAVLYLGQTLTANLVSVICHDGDRGILWTEDSSGAIPHLLFAYNVQPNNHSVAGMQFDVGAQVYLTECFFSAQTGIVDQPIPSVIFGPKFQGSGTVVSSQFNGAQGHTIWLQGGQGFFITGCEIGGNGKYKYATNTYDEIHVEAAVSQVTIDTTHFNVDTLATTGTSNAPRSAVYAASGATNILLSDCIGAGTSYGTAGIIDPGNAVMRNGNVGLGLAGQTTGTGSTVAGTSASDLSASITVPAYDMTVGTVYRFTAFGHGTQARDRSVSLVAGISVGGTSLGTFTAAPRPTPAESKPAPRAAFSWTYTCYLAVTATGPSGTIASNETFAWDGLTTSHGNSSFTVDTTQPNDVVVTASWASAQGSPTITCDRTVLERLQNYPAR